MMTQGMLRNPNIPAGEGSKPAQSSETTVAGLRWDTKDSYLNSISNGSGSPEKNHEPRDGFRLWDSRFEQVLQN